MTMQEIAEQLQETDPSRRVGLVDGGLQKLTDPAAETDASDPLETHHSAAQPSIVQVEAAKLRLVTDRRLGKESPEWLQRVSKGLPPQSVKAAG
jgi:hypothetical protein